MNIFVHSGTGRLQDKWSPPPNLKEGKKKGKEHLWYDRHVPYFIHGHTDWDVIPDTGPVVWIGTQLTIMLNFFFLPGGVIAWYSGLKKRLVGYAFM